MNDEVYAAVLGALVRDGFEPNPTAMRLARVARQINPRYSTVSNATLVTALTSHQREAPTVNVNEWLAAAIATESGERQGMSLVFEIESVAMQSDALQLAKFFGPRSYERVVNVVLDTNWARVDQLRYLWTAVTRGRELPGTFVCDEPLVRIVAIRPRRATLQYSLPVYQVQDGGDSSGGDGRARMETTPYRYTEFGLDHTFALLFSEFSTDAYLLNGKRHHFTYRVARIESGDLRDSRLDPAYAGTLPSSGLIELEPSQEYRFQQPFNETTALTISLQSPHRLLPTNVVQRGVFQFDVLCA